MAGKIFINYRREDSGHVAGRLHDHLAQAFGRDQIFMDVNNIPVGEDFAAHLNSQVAACDVVLAVIGPKWLKAKDKRGQRLHQPDDWVAIEIAAAITRKIRVIPILVDGARMPTESELPASLKALARRQHFEVPLTNFPQHVEALVARMREAMAVDSEKVRLGAEAMRKVEQQKQPEAITLKDLRIPELRPVESVVVPPSPLPPADTSPPRDERLRRLILGRWYDRAENEFHIHDKRDDDSRPVNIRVRQTIKNSDSGYDPPGRVEGEIVRFKCWAPEMANFEGRLVRAPNPSDDTLVGQYIFARGHRDVVLYRSPEPPQPPKLEVPAKIGLPDVTEKSVSDITKWWVGGLPPKR